MGSDYDVEVSRTLLKSKGFVSHLNMYSASHISNQDLNQIFQDKNNSEGVDYIPSRSNINEGKLGNKTEKHASDEVSNSRIFNGAENSFAQSSASAISNESSHDLENYTLVSKVSPPLDLCIYFKNSQFSENALSNTPQYRYIIYPFDLKFDSHFLNHSLHESYRENILQKVRQTWKDVVSPSSYYFIVHKDGTTRTEMKKNLSIITFEALISSNIVLPYIKKMNFLIHPERWNLNEGALAQITGWKDNLVDSMDSAKNQENISSSMQLEVNINATNDERTMSGASNISMNSNSVKRLSIEALNLESHQNLSTNHRILPRNNSTSEISGNFESNSRRKIRSPFIGRKVISIYSWRVCLIDYLHIPWIQSIKGELQLFFKEINRRSWSYFLKFEQSSIEKSQHFPPTFQINLAQIESCILDREINSLSIIAQVEGILTTLKFEIGVEIPKSLEDISLSGIDGFVILLEEIGFRNYQESSSRAIQLESVPIAISSDVWNEFGSQDFSFQRMVSCDFECITSGDIWAFISNTLPHVKVAKLKALPPQYVQLSNYFFEYYQSNKILFSSIVKYKKMLKRTARLLFVVTDTFLLFFKIKNPYSHGSSHGKSTLDKGLHLKTYNYDYLSSIVDICWRPPTYGADDAKIQLTTRNFQIVFSIASSERVNILCYLLEKYRGITISRDDQFRSTNHQATSEAEDLSNSSSNLSSIVGFLVKEENRCLSGDYMSKFHHLLMKYHNKFSTSPILTEVLPRYMLYLATKMEQTKLELEIQKQSFSFLNLGYRIKFKSLLFPHQRDRLVSSFRSKFNFFDSTDVSNQLCILLSEITDRNISRLTGTRQSDSVFKELYEFEEKLRSHCALNQHTIFLEGLHQNYHSSRPLKKFEKESQKDQNEKIAKSKTWALSILGVVEEFDHLRQGFALQNSKWKSSLLNLMKLCQFRCSIMESLEYKDEFGTGSKNYLDNLQDFVQWTISGLENFETISTFQMEHGEEIRERIQNLIKKFSPDFEVLDLLTSILTEMDRSVDLKTYTSETNSKNGHVYVYPPLNKVEVTQPEIPENTLVKEEIISLQTGPELSNELHLQEDDAISNESDIGSEDHIENLETFSSCSGSGSSLDNLDPTVKSLRDLIVSCEEDYERKNPGRREKVQVIVTADNPYTKDIISAILTIFLTSWKHNDEIFWMSYLKTSSFDILSSLVVEFEEMNLVSINVSQAQHERAFIAFLLDNENIDIFFQYLIKRKEDLLLPTSILYMEESQSHQVFCDCIFHILTNRFYFSLRDYTMEKKPIKFLRDTVIRIILEYKRQMQLNPGDNFKFPEEVSRGEYTRVGRLVREKLFVVLQYILVNGMFKKGLLVKPHPWNFISACFSESFTNIENNLKDSRMYQTKNDIQFTLFEYLHFNRIIEMIAQKKLDNDRKVATLLLHGINRGILEELFEILVIMAKGHYKANSFLIVNGDSIIEILSPLKNLPFNLYIDE